MSALPSMASPPAGWTPRVIAAGDDFGTPLRRHFLDYVVPQHLVDADPSTITEMLTTVSYWETATNHAPVEAWREGLPKFLDWIKITPFRGRLRSPATRRKHVSNLQFMLDLAGPSSRERDAAGLIEQPPKIRRPKGAASILKRPLDLAEIARVLEAAQQMHWQRNALSLPACAFWRCLVLFLYNTGLRIETVSLLRWEWLVENDQGQSLAIPAAAMKRDEPFSCYVSPAAARALKPLRSLERPLIFPFPWHLNQARRKFTELLRRAEVARQGLLENKFHALRRSCSVELQKINVFAAKLQLGHSTRDVTLNHYSSASVLIDAHQKLPQPIWSGDFYGRQRRLFE